MTEHKGYLIVLAEAKDWAVTPENLLNPSYKGLFRIPAWPSEHPEESEALDKYVFHEKDDTGFLPEINVVQRLMTMLRRSPRQFEVIFCSEAEENESDDRPAVLGYDVAARNGDFWSIVGDFPHEPAMARFLSLLNKNGCSDALLTRVTTWTPTWLGA
jgi:hypothetical protein